MSDGGSRSRDALGACALILMLAATTAAAWAATGPSLTTPAPWAATAPPVDRVAFEPRPGSILPFDDWFVDEHGRSVPLGDYFGARPAIVVLGYYGCSNLCSVLLKGLATSLAAAALHAGADVEVVVVSIAALETPELAMRKKRAVLDETDDALEGAGWHFLTGTQASIDRLAAPLGYRYDYVERERQYAHGAGIVIVGSDARVVRTLYGVAFPTDALRNAVHEAAPAGHRGVDAESPARVRELRVQDASTAGEASAPQWLLCFRYDPRTGRYDFVAMNAVRLAAFGALLALGAFIARALLRERRLLRGGTESKWPS